MLKMRSRYGDPYHTDLPEMLSKYAGPDVESRLEALAALTQRVLAVLPPDQQRLVIAPLISNTTSEFMGLR